jgi:hypothetical protein
MVSRQNYWSNAVCIFLIWLEFVHSKRYRTMYRLISYHWFSFNFHVEYSRLAAAIFFWIRKETLYRLPKYFNAVTRILRAACQRFCVWFMHNARFINLWCDKNDFHSHTLSNSMECLNSYLGNTPYCRIFYSGTKSRFDRNVRESS